MPQPTTTGSGLEQPAIMYDEQLSITDKAFYRIGEIHNLMLDNYPSKTHFNEFTVTGDEGGRHKLSEDFVDKLSEILNHSWARGAGIFNTQDFSLQFDSRIWFQDRIVITSNNSKFHFEAYRCRYYELQVFTHSAEVMTNFVDLHKDNKAMPMDIQILNAIYNEILLHTQHESQ
ncbi:hypothetical protein M0R04_00735 [Candidatus Dojkabacteria bacterium]|nr:hypothetical protein [Candidatus Dojkabacteria bacterium]